MRHNYMGHDYMAPTWMMMSMAIEMVSPRRPGLNMNLTMKRNSSSSVDSRMFIWTFPIT